MNRRKIWVVFVRDVGAEHVALVQRYNFLPTKKPGVFARRFESVEQAIHTVEHFKPAGLHGVIKQRWEAVPIVKHLPPGTARNAFDASISRRVPAAAIRKKFERRQSGLRRK